MRGAHLAVDGVRVVLEVASESEIRHLHDAVGGEQDVRGFEVAVHHAVAVEVRHGVGDGAEERPHLGLVEKATLLASAADQTLEVAPGGPLEHDDEGLIVEERVEHLDDVRVSEVAQELHLAEAPIALAPRHVAHVHALDRHRATVRESLALVHHAVTALTDLLTHAVPTVELGHGLGGDGGEAPARIARLRRFRPRRRRLRRAIQGRPPGRLHPGVRPGVFRVAHHHHHRTTASIPRARPVSARPSRARRFQKRSVGTQKIRRGRPRGALTGVDLYPFLRQRTTSQENAGKTKISPADETAAVSISRATRAESIEHIRIATAACT